MAASFEDIQETCASRRSVRRYRREKVPRTLLRQLVQAAHWAPSNWNSQPWKFVVLDEPRHLASFNELLAQRVKAAKDAGPDDRVFEVFVGHCEEYFHVLQDSPVIIAACYKPLWPRMERMVAERLGDASGGAGWNPNLLSLGMAAQNLLLAAHAVGLGACFHSGPIAFLREAFQAAYGLPPKLELAGVITVGWPGDGSSGPGTRKPLERVLSFTSEEG